mmetsp:Transcript_91592/g.159973  ORF Transcript_91592/g.159973 Transcript_91592/m.159973 type:complete len:215 (-) Transcript_91592:772-1416(-)
MTCQLLEALKINKVVAHGCRDAFDVYLIQAEVPQSRCNLPLVELPDLLRVNLIELHLQMLIVQIPKRCSKSRAHQAVRLLGHARNHVVRCLSESTENWDVVDLCQVGHCEIVACDFHARHVRLCLPLAKRFELFEVELLLFHVVEEALNLTLGFSVLLQSMVDLPLVQVPLMLAVNLVEGCFNLRVCHGSKAEGATETVSEELREVTRDGVVVD